MMQLPILCWLLTMSLASYGVVLSVTKSLRQATSMRLLLLADPETARSRLCSNEKEGEGDQEVCKLQVFRRLEGRLWVNLCDGTLPKARRWYRLEVTCSPFSLEEATWTARTTLLR